MAKQKIKAKAESEASASHSALASQSGGARSSTTVGAIVILLLYQGYTLSIVGIASPWIAKSFALDEGRLARLFAWMAISAFGSLLLARVADRVGRRPVILGALLLAPLFSAGAALAPTPRAFAACEIMVSALLGGSVSSAIVLLAEELPGKQRARGQAAAALASAVGGVLGYLIIPGLLAWNYSWRWLLAPSAAGILLALPVAMMNTDPSFHVEHLPGRDLSAAHLEPPPRFAECRKLAMQRRHDQLHRLRRHLSDEASQALVVQLRCGVVQQQAGLYRRAFRK